MKTASSAPAAPSTRRKFDREEALEAAMKLFWEYGYEAASMSMLLEAMGLTAPSLYAAFGNKEKLFHEAVGLYSRLYGAKLFAPLFDETRSGREAIEHVLRAATDIVTAPSNPSGCLISFGALKTSDPKGPVPTHLHELRREIEGWFRARIERAAREKEIPASTDSARLARYFLAILGAIQLRSLDGTSRAELRAFAEDAMAAWPGKK